VASQGAKGSMRATDSKSPHGPTPTFWEGFNPFSTSLDSVVCGISTTDTPAQVYSCSSLSTK